jgi:hypothetical protein
MARDRPAIDDRLRSFIRDGAARQFDWIECNCGFWVCDWIALVRGFDPVADYRKRFKTAAGFKRHVLAVGGNEAFSRAIAERAGLNETDRPKVGDVGVIDTQIGAAMAIKVPDDKWVAKGADGVVISPATCLIAWAV